MVLVYLQRKQADSSAMHALSAQDAPELVEELLPYLAPVLEERLLPGGGTQVGYFCLTCTQPEGGSVPACARRAAASRRCANRRRRYACCCCACWPRSLSAATRCEPSPPSLVSADGGTLSSTSEASACTLSAQHASTSAGQGHALATFGGLAAALLGAACADAAPAVARAACSAAAAWAAAAGARLRPVSPGLAAAVLPLATHPHWQVPH